MREGYAIQNKRQIREVDSATWFKEKTTSSLIVAWTFNGPFSMNNLDIVIFWPNLTYHICCKDSFFFFLKGF